MAVRARPLTKFSYLIFYVELGQHINAWRKLQAGWA